jgi:hypothetical protein
LRNVDFINFFITRNDPADLKGRQATALENVRFLLSSRR